jgi:beta-glucosidase
LRAAGKLSDEVIDARAFAVLRTVQTGVRASIETVRNNTAPEVGRITPEDMALNRQAAAEAIVLLKNTAGVLPVNPKKVKKILVTGPNAKTRTVSGGGSALLTSSYIVTPVDGIKAAVAGEDVEVLYSAGCYGKWAVP